MNPSQMPRPGSDAAHRRASRVIPGGVNSPARAFGAVGGIPITMAQGNGPFLTDIDGRSYLDYIGSWGPMIVGHAHPHVQAAVRSALERGTSFGAPTAAEADLAEIVVGAMPSIELIRFVNSGTEAAMSAVRLARGFTGRDSIIKFAGCYHGHADSLLVQAGSAATTLGVPNSPGIPQGATRDTSILPYNDAQAVVDLFRERGDQIAGVILEPVAGNMGLVPTNQEFLAALRRLTHQHGALLIYDEVMTGFRLAWGGAQSLQRIQPDLTILGKIIGGGLPVGAYGGRRDVMGKISPAGPVFQAGTLSGNPLAMAAGIATLRELRDHPPYEKLEQLSQHLEQGMAAAAQEAGVPHCVQRQGSMLTLFFTEGPVRNYSEAKASRTDRFARFFWSLMDRGVYWPCSQFEAAFVSAVHTDAHVEQTVAACREALADAAQVK